MDIPREEEIQFFDYFENFFDVQLRFQSKRPHSFEENYSLFVAQLSRNNRGALKKNVIQSCAQNFERSSTTNELDDRLESFFGNSGRRKNSQ